MASFDLAVKKVLTLEGAYQNDPTDWGNYNIYDTAGNPSSYGQHLNNLRAGTKYGISTVLYSGILKREVKPEEMQAITKNRAIAIYQKLYWDAIQGDQIHSQKVAELVFDSYVNHGKSGAKIVQKVLNAMGANLVVDGIIGTKSRAAINSANPDQLVSGILQARAKFYNQIVSRKPDHAKFLNGWINRLKAWGYQNKTAAAALPIGLVAGVVLIMYKLAKDE